MEFHYGFGMGMCPGGCLGTGLVPGKEWVVPSVSPLALVRDVGSTWRVPMFLGLRQPVGLGAGGGRVLPLGCHGAEGSARCVCYNRHPSHVSRRRARFLVSIVTRCLPRADGAQKSSIYIRPLLAVFRRGVRRGVRCFELCPGPVGCALLRT